MPNFKCLYCDRYFSFRQAYAQHVNKTHYNINDMSLDAENSNRIEELQTVQEERLPSITNEYEDQNMPPVSHEYDVLSNFPKDYDIDQTSQSNFDQYDRFEESNIEDYDNFEQVSPERLQSNYEEPEEQLEENIMEFPNETHADLMELVIKHNLNNKAGNAIIKFFNKHSGLSISPLPKNIEAGRKRMDLMSIHKLPHSKHCILDHQNKKYFIYYRPIKSCIESLLSNPKIIENFVYKYQFLQVIIIFILLIYIKYSLLISLFIYFIYY